MKRDIFNIPFKCAFAKENVAWLRSGYVYANAVHLLFMANDLVKSFELRKCQLRKMLGFYIIIYIDNR